MDKIELELFEGFAIDTLTGKDCQKSIYIKSGMREIYIAVNTVLKLAEFLREKGFRI